MPTRNEILHHRIVTKKEMKESLEKNQCPYCDAELFSRTCPNSGIKFGVAARQLTLQRRQ